MAKDLRMSPAGRPPLSDSRKENRLSTMLTDSERVEIDSAAAIAGQPTSTWARTILLAAARSANLVKKPAKKKPAK